MRKRLIDNEHDESFEISLTPLIDTVLVLLIVFIAAAPIIHQSIKVSLPSGSFSEYSDLKKDICFAIDQYGNIYNSNKKKISSENAINEIYKKIYENNLVSVVLFIDRDALCGSVIEFIDKIKNTGIKDVYCKTKKIKL